MASLESTLASIPGYGGYIAKRQMNEQQELGDLQKAHLVQGILAQIQQQELMKQFAGGMAGGGSPDQLDAVALKLAAGGHPGAAAIGGLADKRRAQAADAATLKTIQSPAPSPIQSQPSADGLKRVANIDSDMIPGTDWTNPTPDQVPAEERPAFDKVLNDARANNAQTRGEGGLFSTLMQSDIPAIANQAKLFQQQANVADPRSVKPQHWVDLQKQLATQEATLLERRTNAQNRQEPLVSIIGPDGKPVLVPRSQAIGKTPGNTPDASAMLDKESLEVAGWEKLLFGTDAKGLGKASAEQRKQISEERTRIGKGLGLSPMEIAMMPQDNKVKMKAVDALTKWGAFVDKGADQLVPSIDLAISYAQKMDPTRLQTLNKAIISGRTEFNDPTANAYAVAVNTVRREYGRLMSGPTSNAMLPVEAMKQSDHLVSTAFDVPTWNEVKNVIMQDAGYTKAAVRKQIDSLRSSMLPPGASPVAAPTATAQTPGAPKVVDFRSLK